MQSTDWLVKESAILAAGAVAEGCMETILHAGIAMPLVQMLIEVIKNDPQPLVRSISCWTLSRFSVFLFDHRELFEQVRRVPMWGARGLTPQAMGTLLDAMMLPSRKVQEGAVSAVSTISETAGPLLVPLLPKMVHVGRP